MKVYVSRLLRCFAAGFLSTAGFVAATNAEEAADRKPEQLPAGRTVVLIESLPGAGRKTANVVLNMVFGAHTMAVDTHVFRVANRTGMAPGRTPTT